ncbi:hypothetical protein VULLAG_LOCUS11999 [Vulpes lagopus]
MEMPGASKETHTAARARTRCRLGWRLGTPGLVGVPHRPGWANLPAQNVPLRVFVPWVRASIRLQFCARHTDALPQVTGQDGTPSWPVPAPPANVRSAENLIPGTLVTSDIRRNNTKPTGLERSSGGDTGSQGPASCLSTPQLG